MQKFEEFDVSFNIGLPFKPFEQLLSVLPIASSKFLPKALRNLMTDANSPISDLQILRLI